MLSTAFICGLLGIILSTIGMTGFAIKEHKKEKRRTLSELAAKDQKTLLEFRIITWVCGGLISVMMYWLVIPRMPSSLWFTIIYIVIIGGELLAATLPARDNKLGKLHELIAYGMGIGMLLLALSHGASFTGVYSAIEYTLFGMMILLCILTLKYWDHFLYFEIPFIFLSHVSIFAAAIALS
jgi:cadmium resistance protein CadD (predicted permease)